MSNDTSKVEVFSRLFKQWAVICKMIMDGSRNAFLVADYLQRIIDPNLPLVELVYPWVEKDGIIRFDFVAPGWSGSEWEKFYNENGYEISIEAKRFLKSPDFRSTPAGTKVQVAVLKGELLSDGPSLMLEDVRAEAHNRKLKNLNHDIACFIRRFFLSKEIEKKMKLCWIIGMSDTIDNGLLLVDADDFGTQALDMCGDSLGGEFDRRSGFAFEVPQ